MYAELADIQQLMQQVFATREERSLALQALEVTGFELDTALVALGLSIPAAATKSRRVLQDLNTKLAAAMLDPDAWEAVAQRELQLLQADRLSLPDAVPLEGELEEIPESDLKTLMQIEEETE